jgi:hypothetical protein
MVDAKSLVASVAEENVYSGCRATRIKLGILEKEQEVF